MIIFILFLVFLAIRNSVSDICLDNTWYELCNTSRDIIVGRNCATDMTGRLDALLDDINHTNIGNGNIGNAYLMDIHNHRA